MSALSSLKASFEVKFSKPEVMSFDKYLDLCKSDKMAYATSAERMVAAIGTPKVVDTSEDARLSRIHSNKKVRIYEAFQDFYGAEDAIERLAAYFRHASAGLEESKQILYLKGPVGGGKSSIVERLKTLMEKFPIYVLYDANEKDPELATSPV